MLPKDLSFEAHPLAHLPVVRSLIDDLGITGVVDTLLPKDPRSKVSDADCLAVMILNILGGRTALYRMELWTKKLPVDVLIGDHCAPEDFSDARLARTLDHLFETGTDKVLGQIVAAYLARPDRERTYSVHQDTTSVKVYGAYEGEPPGWAPRMAFGFSKDHRPDLKQLVFGLSLHGSVGLPLVSTMFDGNTSDQYANAFHIEMLAGLLPDEDNVTLVGDSKLVDARTVGELLAQGFHFVSQLPRTFSVRREVTDRLVGQPGPWPELARTPARRKADPDTVYRGQSYESHFTIHPPHEDGSREITLRFLVVHSSALAEKFGRELPKKLEREREKFAKAFDKVAKRPFSCREDALAAAERLRNTLKLHQCELSVETAEVDAKRPRGRPRKGSRVARKRVFPLILGDLVVDEEAVEAERRSRTFFVLVTDHLDQEAWTDADVFAEYRHQHLVEGVTGFRWLKGPAQVAPIFLKRPQRIAGLGLVLILALMVRNYLQFTVRNHLGELDETVPYYDRKRVTDKPTAEVIWELFSDLLIVSLSVGGVVVERRLQGMDRDKRRVLEFMGIPEDKLLRRILKSGCDPG